MEVKKGGHSKNHLHYKAGKIVSLLPLDTSHLFDIQTPFNPH